MTIDLGKNFRVQIGKAAIFEHREGKGAPWKRVGKCTKKAQAKLGVALLLPVYLPMDCPECGRRRVELVDGFMIECEKCGWKP